MLSRSLSLFREPVGDPKVRPEHGGFLPVLRALALPSYHQPPDAGFHGPFAREAPHFLHLMDTNTPIK